MSMNLFCEEVELYQLPTYISCCVYSNNDGGWKGVLYRYKMFFKHEYQDRINGLKDPEDKKLETESLHEHFRKIDAAAKKHKILHFGVS